MKLTSIRQVYNYYFIVQIKGIFIIYYTAHTHIYARKGIFVPLVFVKTGSCLPMRSRRCDMEQQKIIDEINYHKAQAITELLYASGMITVVEYDKLSELNRQSFSPLYADLLPKTLDKSSVQS